MRNGSLSARTSGVALALCIIIVTIAFTYLYTTVDGCPWWTVDDWATCFRPAALNLDNPYAVAPGAYPVWYYVVLWPLAILPVHLGHGILTTLSILVLGIYLKDWWRVGLLTLSTPVLVGLLYGHVDALLVLAFMAPTDVALVIASFKPVALAGWAVRRWLASKSWYVTMTPVLVLFFASSIIWGPWWEHLAMGNLAWGHSLALHWPAMIPIGLLLLLTKDERLWLVGSLFLTPYLMRYHLTPLLAYFYRRQPWYVLMIVTVVTWAWTFWGGF